MCVSASPGKAEDHEGHLTQQHRERVRTLYREIDEKVEAIDLTRTQLKVGDSAVRLGSGLDTALSQPGRVSLAACDSLKHQIRRVWRKVMIKL